MYIFFKEVKELQRQIKELTEKVVELENWKKSINFVNPSKDAHTVFDIADPLFEDAKKLVIEEQRVLTSRIMRKLGTGYARTAKIIDQLEEAGVIGPPYGSKPRKVLIKEFDSK
jgi:S-DNA-T family DNA segregation ATPase FtsK/SpoIIIE